MTKGFKIGIYEIRFFEISQIHIDIITRYNNRLLNLIIYKN